MIECNNKNIISDNDNQSQPTETIHKSLKGDSQATMIHVLYDLHQTKPTQNYIAAFKKKFN